MSMSENQEPSASPDQNADLRPHTYDGIQEYDNRLPNWWLWTFYGAIIFSIVYWFSWYDATITTPDEKRLEARMAEIEEARLASIGELSNETLWEMSENPGFVDDGEEIYVKICLTCHGKSLEGGIGLSLVDNEWRWGKEPMDVFNIVMDGSPDPTAGMQAWATQLGPDKVSRVVAYVLSHHTREEMQNATVLNPNGL